MNGMSSPRAMSLHVLTVVLASLISLQVASAEDWPCYRADAARSAKGSEPLDFPLQTAWVYQAAQAPQPAWPDPVKEPHVMDFDVAFEPVVADGLVLFGNSADDCVRALDLTTGALKWRFVTGGPVRFAPAVFEGAAYVVSDDGWLYCLDAATGSEKWKYRGGVNDRLMLGAGRMISRWPLRSGVLVDGGVVYFTAGMWPSGGVFVCAVDARTGEEIWVNGTSGSRFRNQPHPLAAALTGVAPQGYLAATDRVLLVPTGRAVPAAYDRRTGELLHYRQAAFRLWGGAWCVVGPSQESFVCGYGKRTMRATVLTGERYGDDWKSMGEDVLPSRQVRAGDVTVRGLDGGIAAYDVEGKEIWRRSVEGEARGLAVSEGRLVVSTSAGHVSCFGPAQAPQAADGPRVRPERATGFDDSLSADKMAEQALSLASQNEITKGYALVLGDTDGRMAARLAADSELHVLAVPGGSRRVSAIRNALLDETVLYGTRVSVLGSESLASGYLPSFFANLIVVAGPVAEEAQGDLYRLLRPCGGLMTMPGLSASERNKLLRAASIPGEETRNQDGSILVVRGKLEGAFDWDSEVPCDQRVRWPLEVLWFGPPGPAVMLDRHFFKTPTVPNPVAANGRIFQVGPHYLVAVDAYNGTVLWKRDMPYAAAPPHPFLKNLAADDESVYLDFGKVTYQIDAQTGAQQKVYGEFEEPERFSLADRQVFEIGGADAPSGRIGIETTPGGLKVTMTVGKAEFQSYESWELFFDFRPADRRMNLYEPGVFQLAIQSRTGQLRPLMMVSSDGAWDDRVYAKWGTKFGGNTDPVPLPGGVGPVYPDVQIESKRTEERTTLVLTMPWEEIRKVAGFQPGEFGFAGALVYAAPGTSLKGEGKRLSRGEPPLGGESITVWRRSYLFGDEYAGIFNNGWPVFDIPETSVPAKGVDDPSHVAAERADLPEVALRQGRQPSRPGGSIAERNDLPSRAFRWGRLPSRPGEHTGGKLPVLDTKMPHPLTGTDTPVIYGRTYGCGGSVASATMDFFRSATLACYSYSDNSGVRYFGGIRTSCGRPGNMIPALGLLVAMEGSSGCRCAYNYQTSLALVPARHRKHEDWALYNDRGNRTDFSPPTGTPISHQRVNLGAPGDRRDDQGNLWLGYPRVAAYLQSRVLAMPLPVDVKGGDAFERYRFNADRRIVHRTKRPWLYGSGYSDVQAVELSLSYYNPHGDAMALLCEEPPTIDGVIDDVCWRGNHAVLLPRQNAVALLRYDQENLYIAYERRHDAHGAKRRPTEIKVDLKGHDVPVWEDDCMEVYFGDERGNGPMLHFGVSAGDARYDGSLPKLGAKEEDATWNAEWKGRAHVRDGAFAIEASIPWSVLESRGLKKEQMTVNFRARQPMENEGGNQSRLAHALRLVDSEPEERIFTVRLYFAEVKDAEPGERVFDIAIQGRTVLEDLDIRAETGATDTALVKEFKGIPARRSIRVEFMPSGRTGGTNGPLLSAIEAVAEH